MLKCCFFIVWFEPTDSNKATQPFLSHSESTKIIKFASPNLNELKIMTDYFNIPTQLDGGRDDLKNIIDAAEQLGKIVPVVITTLGHKGLLV